jgi:chromosome segregation protein
MKLTQLRLHGFKSFVDAADIDIPPGITGIVGPNGCGKSNLIEALRFVMGESSYKAMRGGGMEDVIFSGSGNRPARDMAEVTLVAEHEGTSSKDSETIEIARRIERDSGSTYRINGREARARDVQILFADAATGARSSAFVRQGQIGELIAMKPIQRRGVLEDAAGISGLHARRDEAEQKLKGAEQNLERLDDVMSELGGRLDGLKRQARQAIRYRKISGEIRKAEAILSALHWEHALARLAEAEAELSEASRALAAASEAQRAAAAEEEAAVERLPALRQKAGAAAAALERLQHAAEAIDREEAQLKARRQELNARRAQAAADLKNEAELGADAEAAFARLDDEEARLRQEGSVAAERIAQARATAEEAAAAVTASEAEFAAAAGALAAAGAERAARERAIRESHAKLRRLEEERGSVLRQRDRIQESHGGEEAARAAAAALAEAEALLAECEAGSETASQALADAREAERRARAPHEAAERNLAELQAEARTLAELLDLERTKGYRPVIDALEVEAGFEKALVAALGDDLDASLDVEAPAFWGPCGPDDKDPALPDGAEALVKFVKGPENLTRRLRQIGVVTKEAAAMLLPQLAAGQSLVTREGGLWRWDGFRAEVGSAAAGARRLEQRSRVALLIQELKTARAAVEKALDIFGATTQARAEAEHLEARTRNTLREARQAVDERRRTLTEAERHASRIGERLSAFAGALARIEADTDGSRAELRTAGDALDGLPDTSELTRQRDELQAQLAAHRGRAAETRLEAEKAAHQDTMRVGRLSELAAERQRWESRRKRAEERMAELDQRLSGLDADIAAIADDPLSFEEQRRKLRGESDAAERTAAEAAEDLSEAETEHRRLADVARGMLDARSEARERLARDEERRIAAGARKDELFVQIQEHFGRPPEELREIAELAADAPLPAAEAMETRVHRLKNERERLGGVNLRAEEEARELETRLDAMRTERQDLEEAIKRLRHGIQNLNREGRERLLAAFEEVNGHFGSLFQSLFGGGTAELTLTGSDDPLEAGLEIVARPPGKRPHTMTLLSGGEQALTALSLIFAVFLTNPSPICVLDEVDAPLDDANVERFCALLEDMRQRTETRFVVVTHNPITMARMDRLYGVTMAERGVSQVVSVDLEAAERFREAS